MSSQDLATAARKQHRLEKFLVKLLAFVCIVIALAACTGCNFIAKALSDPRDYENSGFFSVAWSLDGSRIAVGGARGIFTLNDGLQPVDHIEPVYLGNPETIYFVTWHPDGDLIAGSGNGTVVLYHLDHSRIEHLSIASGFMDWSPDGERLITAGNNTPDGNFQLQTWSVNLTSPSTSVQAITTLSGHSGSITSALWSPDGSLIASASDRDGTIKIWDSEIGQLLHTLIHPANERVGSWISISWSPDGSMLVSANSDGQIRIWNVSNGDVVLNFEEGSEFGALSVMWSPDGTRLVTAGEDNVKIWSVTTGQLQSTLYAQHRAINQAIWSPDGSKIAAIGTIQERSRATIWLWDVSTGELLATVH
jgi:WD40 repeat protein